MVLDMDVHSVRVRLCRVAYLYFPWVIAAISRPFPAGRAIGYAIP